MWLWGRLISVVVFCCHVSNYTHTHRQTNSADAPSNGPRLYKGRDGMQLTGRTSSKNPQKKEQLNPDKVAAILGN